MNYRRSAVLVLGFIFSMPLIAASAPPDEVAKLVHDEMLQQHIPGLALLVSKNGKPIRSEGYGLSNVELNVSAKPETIFQSGSVGKQFTATAVMMLVEAGKVGLEDPLTKYFPDAPASWKQVTVRELLSHTAGFTDYPKDFDMRKDYTEGGTAQDRRVDTARLPAGHQLELQQPRVSHARRSDPQSDRRVLRRLPAAADLSATGHGNDPHDERGGYHSQSFGRIPARAGPS